MTHDSSTMAERGGDTPRSAAHSSRTILAIAAMALVALACTCGLIPSTEEILSRVEFPESEELLEAMETVESFGGTDGTESSAGATSTPRSGSAVSAGNPLPALIDQGLVEVESVQSNEGGQTQGPILTVQLTNLESGEVVVDVPCGLIFHPGSEEDQRMMVIQPASGELSASGTTQISPYVICIDSGKDAPDLNAIYQVGVMAEGDLLKIAQCICQEELSDDLDAQAGFDQFGIQFAVWAVSDGEPLMSFTGEGMPEGGAADDLFGEEFGDMFAELEQLFLAPAQEWLDRCGIELESE